MPQQELLLARSLPLSMVFSGGDSTSNCTRYYVLLLFAWLGTQQCLCWYTFGSIPSALSYFGLTTAEADAFADLTMDWGAAGFVVSLPAAVYTVRRYGIRCSMRICGVLTFACCLMRWLPCVLLATASSRKRWLWVLHVGSWLNAFVGAFYSTACTTLSATYFPPHQRTTATAVGYMGGNLGMLLGYALGALFGTPSNGLFGEAALPSLLLVELLLAVPALILVWPLPAPPRQRKSARTEDANAKADVEAGAAANAAAPPPVTLALFAREVGRALMQPSLLFLVAAGGIEAGANAAWGGLLPQIFATRWSKTTASRVANECGLLNVSGSLLGMVLAGVVADRCFRRRLKEMAMACFIASAAVTALVTAQFATPWAHAPLWAAPEVPVAVTLFIAGIFSGMLDPLCLELAAEVGYPTSEATSSGLLTFAYNAAALLVLSLSPVLPTMWLNLGYAVVFILCALLMLGVKALYGRTDAAAALAGKDAAAKVHLLADVAAESGSAVDAVAAR